MSNGTAIPRGLPADVATWTQAKLIEHARAIWALYQQDLGRAPDVDGLCAYLWRMGYYKDTAEQVRASLRDSDEYAALHPAPPAPVPSTGGLRIVQGGFADASGPVNPVFCHAGDLFALYVRDPETVRGQLDVVRDAGYMGIRFWTTLGGDYWTSKGREVGESTTPDYWGRLATFLGDLHARGLRNIISQGDVGLLADRPAFMRRLGTTIDAVGAEVAASVDAGNEAWQTGEPDPVRLAEMVTWFRAVCPGPLLTLTSPPGETKAELDAYSLDPADLYDVHGYRGGHWWDKVRHIFSLAYEGQPARRLGVQSEPTGPGPLVSVTEYQDELTDDTLAAMAVMSLMSRQAWVYMSSHGVSWQGPLERQPGFYSVPKAVALLPPDITSWPTLIHGGERWAGTRVFAAWGDVRADQACSADGRVACLLDGPASVIQATPERPIVVTTDERLSPHVRLVVGRLA
ncbi:MAG: hypothetical protein PHR30_16570 [Gallionellaceae bacterium]|nr:hypothetical protein [Gallionellaceae bacterium]